MGYDRFYTQPAEARQRRQAGQEFEQNIRQYEIPRMQTKARMLRSSVRNPEMASVLGRSGFGLEREVEVADAQARLAEAAAQLRALEQLRKQVKRR